MHNLAYSSPEWKKRFKLRLLYKGHHDPAIRENERGKTCLCVLIGPGEREKLLVDLAPLIDIGMEVDLRGLDGCMAQVLLDYAEVLRTLVQLARIAVADLVGSDTLRGIMPEYMLDCTGGDMLALLADKERPDDPVTDELRDLGQGLLVDKNRPDFVALPADPDGVFIKINVLDIDAAEFGNTDTGCIDRPDNQFVPVVLDGIYQAEDLVVFQVFDLLLLYPGPVDPRQGIGPDNLLGVEKTIKGAERRDDAMERLGFIGLHR